MIDVEKLKKLHEDADEAQAPATGGRPEGAKWGLGDTVAKKRGSSWRGKVVGFYATENTEIGYSIESMFEPGSVQVWPEAALEDWAPSLPAPDTAGEVVASSRCPVCGLDEPHQHNAFEAMELRHRRFPATNDEWLRYVGRKIDPTMINELDLLHKKAVRFAYAPQAPATVGDADVTYEVWEDDMLVASSTDEADARHYLAVYSQDGPVRLVKAVTYRSEMAALSGGAEGGEAPTP